MALVVGTTLCRNCSNIAEVVTGTPGTQQCSHVHVEVLEVEQEELLQDNAPRRKYGEEWVTVDENEEVHDSKECKEEEDDADDDTT